MGWCEVKNGIVYVCEEMPHELQKETLLHEIIHYIAIDCGIELSEQCVSTLSVALFGVLKNNGEL